MNQDPKIRSILQAVAAAAAVLLLGGMLFASTAGATQPACTGDRHYDSEANGCCPNVAECPTPEVCAPVLPCPDPAPCQPVTCKCEESVCVFDAGSCPQPEVAEICKVRRDGTVVCPRSKKARRHGNGARRILVPQSIIDKIADVKGY